MNREGGHNRVMRHNEAAGAPAGLLPPDAGAAVWEPAEGGAIALGLWVRIALLGGLIIAVHWDILRRLAWFAWTDGDWSHAFLLPALSAYFIYQRRGRLREAEARPCWWALAAMGAALGLYAGGIAWGSDALKGYAMIGQLAAVVLLLGGPGVLRQVWFPIAFLAFGVKLPEAVWGAVAWQMQLLAAHSAVGVLNVVGLDAVVTETTIELYDGWQRLGTLNVAEACSGMRMLITFLALGSAAAYLWERTWWSRALLVAATVPIAIVVNVGRVAVLGLVYLIDPSYATGDFHIFLGMVMLVPAAGLFLLVGWALAKLGGEAEEGG